MKITATRKYEQISIYINGIIHVRIKLLDMIGFQSWIHGESEYFIEYYFTGGGKISTVYGNKKLWEEILKVIDKHLTVEG